MLYTHRGPCVHVHNIQPSGWSDLYSLHLFDPEKRQLRELLQQQGVLRSVALYILDDRSTSAASDARVPEVSTYSETDKLVDHNQLDRWNRFEHFPPH